MSVPRITAFSLCVDLLKRLSAPPGTALRITKGTASYMIRKVGIRDCFEHLILDFRKAGTVKSDEFFLKIRQLFMPIVQPTRGPVAILLEPLRWNDKVYLTA